METSEFLEEWIFMSCDIFPPKLRYEWLAVPVKCNIACTLEHYSIVQILLISFNLSLPSLLSRYSDETLALFLGTFFFDTIQFLNNSRKFPKSHPENTFRDSETKWSHIIDNLCATFNATSESSTAIRSSNYIASWKPIARYDSWNMQNSWNIFSGVLPS